MSTDDEPQCVKLGSLFPSRSRYVHEGGYLVTFVFPESRARVEKLALEFFESARHEWS